VIALDKIFLVYAHRKDSESHKIGIAAICIETGVTLLWTADRDFSTLPGLRTENPLIEKR